MELKSFSAAVEALRDGAKVFVIAPWYNAPVELELSKGRHTGKTMLKRVGQNFWYPTQVFKTSNCHKFYAAI